MEIFTNVNEIMIFPDDYGKLIKLKIVGGNATIIKKITIGIKKDGEVEIMQNVGGKIEIIQNEGGKNVRSR